MFGFLSLMIVGLILRTQAQERVNYIKVHQDEVTWSDAEDHCANTFGTHLASISNSAENDEVYDLLGSWTYGWIGLNDRATEGTFVWSDGTTFNYNAWNSGIEGQSTASEDCAMHFGNGNWIDIDCDTTVVDDFVCNMPSGMF